MSSTDNRADHGALAVLEAPRPMAVPPVVAAVLGALANGGVEALDVFDEDSRIEAALILEKYHAQAAADAAYLRKALYACRDSICKTLDSEGATRRAHPLAIMEISREIDYDRNPDVIKELEPIVSPEDFAAIYKVEPPPPPEPIVKIDLRGRKKIEKYGAKAKEILERALTPRPGPWKIKWTLTEAGQAALGSGES